MKDDAVKRTVVIHSDEMASMKVLQARIHEQTGRWPSISEVFAHAVKQVAQGILNGTNRS